MCKGDDWTDCSRNNAMQQSPMNRFQTALMFIGSAALLQASMATTAPLRQPLTKWNVDYGDTVCTAARAYGSQTAPLNIAFRPSPNGNVVRLIIARPGKTASARHFPITTSITSAQAKTTGLRFASSKGETEIIWINFDRSAVQGLSTAAEIAIRGKDIDERFALPGMAAVLKALDRCNEDLRVVWNVNEAAAGRLTKNASSLKPLAKYFSDSDYPAQAVREEVSGATRVMMMVDEIGKLRDCMVEQTSGIATLDAMTCGVLLERAKFSPALDAAGKPVRSVSTQTIRWVMPD